MRYKNKKTGSVANVRDDKPMDSDWVPIDGETANGHKKGIGSMNVAELEEYAAGIGLDISKIKRKADKLAAIEEAERAAANQSQDDGDPEEGEAEEGEQEED